MTLLLLLLLLPAGQVQTSNPTPGDQNPVPFQAQNKGATTGLAALAVVLLTTTYSFLVGRGTRLTSKARLPLREVVLNMECILQSHWVSEAVNIPDHMIESNNPFYLAHIGRAAPKITGRELFLMRHVKCQESMKWHWQKLNAPEVRGKCDNYMYTLPAGLPLCRQGCYLTSGSQLTKSVVQLAIWEWWFLWVALIMFSSVICYNGFTTETIRPDGVPRLVVTCLYVTGYVVHAVYVFTSVSNLFSLILAGSAWTMLNQAGFAVIRLTHCKEGGAKVNLCSIDRANEEYVSRSFAYEKYVTSDDMRQPGRSADVYDVTSDLDRDEAIATMKKIQENERKSCQDAGKDALDKIIANGMIMVAVSLSCGFTVWTDVPSSSLTTQIGSWGLLASLSIGMGLMYSSAVQLSIVLEAFKEILTIKEANINDAAVAYVTKQLGRGKRLFGFTQSWQPCGVKWLKSFDFKDKVELLRFIAFGPVSAVLPQSDDMRMALSQAKFAFDMFIFDKLQRKYTYTVVSGNLLSDWESADKVVLGPSARALASEV